MAKNNAFLPNIQLLMSMGFDPKTGLPQKFSAGNDLKGGIKASLRIMDEQDAVNAVRWKNIPADVPTNELERMLYYYSSLAFFYIPELKEFYFMRYALDGGLDFYGRYNYIHPVPMTAGTKEENKAQIEYLAGLKLKVIHDVPTEPLDPNEAYAVLLYDYTKQLSQTILPRASLQEGVLDVMAEMIPYCRTALRNATGISGMRVGNQDEQSNVAAMNSQLEEAALNGKSFLSYIGNLEFQEITGGTPAKAEDYLMTLQSLDNFRLSMHGIDNGGLFQKKAHTLQSENDMNETHVSSVALDKLQNRQTFCDIVNAIWQVGISCEFVAQPREEQEQDAKSRMLIMQGRQNGEGGEDNEE